MPRRQAIRSGPILSARRIRQIFSSIRSGVRRGEVTGWLGRSEGPFSPSSWSRSHRFVAQWREIPIWAATCAAGFPVAMRRQKGVGPEG
jgi:hypothetical protein